LQALAALDPARPILVEAEASKIGDRMVPPSIWKAMLAAPRIVLEVPAAARARFLACHYGGLLDDRAAFDSALARLPSHPGRKTLEAWRELADANALEALAAGLIETHYDPAYDRASRKDARPRLGAVALGDLDPASQDAAADQIIGLIGG